MIHPISDPNELIGRSDISGEYNGTPNNITYSGPAGSAGSSGNSFTDGSSSAVYRASVETIRHLDHDGQIVRSYVYIDENGRTFMSKQNKNGNTSSINNSDWVEFSNNVFGYNENTPDSDDGCDDCHYYYNHKQSEEPYCYDEEEEDDYYDHYTRKKQKAKKVRDTKPSNVSETNYDKRTEGNIMNQFMTLDIGSNKATIDLSKVRKQGLVFEKTMFGRKPKIVIYYIDRPDVPEVNFELNSEEEAQSVYKKINVQLEKWAEESNSAQITRLERELEVMREQKVAMIEEKEVLMSVFNSFKEMMQIMEDDNKTSSLLAKIDSL